MSSSSTLRRCCPAERLLPSLVAERADQSELRMQPGNESAPTFACQAGLRLDPTEKHLSSFEKNFLPKIERLF
jgi:hypothetical protein